MIATTQRFTPLFSGSDCDNEHYAFVNYPFETWSDGLTNQLAIKRMWMQLKKEGNI
jgi:hypothetical protein